MSALALCALCALCRPAPSFAERPDAETVRLVKEAAAKYAAGEFAESAERFMQAYRISGRLNQLRNAAKAFEAAGIRTRAIEAWKECASSKNATLAEVAKAQSEVERLSLEQDPAPEPKTEPQAESVHEPTPEPNVEPRPEPKVSTSSVTLPPTWYAAGEALVPPRPGQAAAIEPETEAPTHVLAYAATLSGVAGVIAAGALFVISEHRISRLDSRLQERMGGLVDGYAYDDYRSEVASINRERTASVVLGVLGVALVAIGAVALWDESSP